MRDMSTSQAAHEFTVYAGQQRWQLDKRPQYGPALAEVRGPWPYRVRRFNGPDVTVWADDSYSAIRSVMRGMSARQIPTWKVG